MHGGRPRRLHSEGNLAERDRVTRHQRDRLLVLEPLAIVEGAVTRAKIADAKSRLIDLQLGVTPRNRWIEDRDVTGWCTPDDELHAGAQLVLLKTVSARKPVPHQSWHCRWNMEREAKLA